MDRAVLENVRALCARTRAASPTIATASHELRVKALARMADALVAGGADILTANETDLANAEANGVPRVMLDRLALTKARVEGIADGIRALIALPDPLASDESWERPSGIQITRRVVPFGVLAMIFEARPNVTADAAALAVKSGKTPREVGAAEVRRVLTARGVEL